MAHKKLSFLLVTIMFLGCFSGYAVPSTSAQTKTITYDNGNNTITCVGGSETNPITFEDIYDSNIAGGWGVIEVLAIDTEYWAYYGGYQFYFFNRTSLILGNGSSTTYFKDYNKMVLFSTLQVSGEFLCIKNNVYADFGYLVNATSKTTSGGVIFQTLSTGNTAIEIENNTNVNFYSCVFAGAKRFDYGAYYQMGISGYIDRVWNCKFFATRITYLDSTDIYNCGFEDNLRGDMCAIYETNNCTINECYVSNYYGVIGGDYNGDLFLYNIIGRENTYINYPTNVGSYNYYFIDCDFDNWVFRYPYENMEGKHYRQYTFNLNVLNGNITDFVEDATVQLWKDSALVYEGTTNSSGMIPTQTLTYGYYQQSTGNAIQNASSPYYLVITHPEWQTYISRFYITEPLRLTVSMQEPTYTGYTEAEKSDYTTIILFVISIILCIIGLALSVPLLPLISLTISVINIIFLSEPTIFNILLIVLNVTFTIITLVRVKTKNN